MAKRFNKSADGFFIEGGVEKHSAAGYFLKADPLADRFFPRFKKGKVMQYEHTRTDSGNHAICCIIYGLLAAVGDEFFIKKRNNELLLVAKVSYLHDIGNNSGIFESKIPPSLVQGDTVICLFQINSSLDNTE